MPGFSNVEDFVWTEADEKVYGPHPSKKKVKEIQTYIAAQGGYKNVKFHLFDFLNSNPEVVPEASSQGVSEEELKVKVDAQRKALKVAEESGYLLPLN